MKVLGVDPGPTTGICVLRSGGKPSWYQCDAGSAFALVRWLMLFTEPDLLAGEAFQPGRGAGARMNSGEVTRAVIRQLDELAYNMWHWRSAGQVKPWATDARIARAGLYIPGMHHAVDAARHALYCAVHDGGMPDPLSKKVPSPDDELRKLAREGIREYSRQDLWKPGDPVTYLTPDELRKLEGYQ